MRETESEVREEERTLETERGNQGVITPEREIEREVNKTME